jgi:hypothetical protein
MGWDFGMEQHFKEYHIKFLFENGTETSGSIKGRKFLD